MAPGLDDLQLACFFPDSPIKGNGGSWKTPVSADLVSLKEVSEREIRLLAHCRVRQKERASFLVSSRGGNYPLALQSPGGHLIYPGCLGQEV